MSDAKFEKVTQSDTPLYGPRKLIVCGFAAALQTSFSKVLEVAGLPGVPTGWATGEQAGGDIGHLMELSADTGTGTHSTLPRAIIAAGINEKEPHKLMKIGRANG